MSQQMRYRYNTASDIVRHHRLMSQQMRYRYNTASDIVRHTA